MDDHRSLRDDIPDYLASRLEGEARLRLEAHLHECPDCADLVEAGRGLVAALRAGGDEIFSPHPDEPALREYALGGRTAERGRVARHLASCASCELEVAAWRLREETARRGPGAGAARADGPRTLASRLHPLSLAAGILLGVGVAALVQFAAGPGGAPPAGGPEPQVEWSGPAPLLVLSSPLRGGTSLPVYAIETGLRTALIAVQPALPEGAPDEAPYRFEIRTASGAIAWSAPMSAAQIRRHLDAAQVVTLAVPAEALAAGRHALRLTDAAAPEAAPLLEIAFEISRPH